MSSPGNRGLVPRRRLTASTMFEALLRPQCPAATHFDHRAACAPPRLPFKLAPAVPTIIHQQLPSLYLERHGFDASEEAVEQLSGFFGGGEVQVDVVQS